MKRSIAAVGAIALAAGFGAATPTAWAGVPPTPSTASPDPVASARALLADNNKLVRGSSQDDFVATGTVAGERGMTHVRFDRTHRGLPVLGGDFVVHQRDGARSTVSSPLGSPVSVSVKPTVGAAAAAGTARRAGLKLLRPGSPAATWPVLS